MNKLLENLNNAKSNKIDIEINEAQKKFDYFKNNLITKIVINISFEKNKNL